MRQSPWGQGTEFHSGIDIRSSQHGTPVRAPAGGAVTIAGTYQEYGITVILDHGQDIKSLYGHLAKTNVKPGERVERGAVVGWSGNTGPLDRAHLHFEILVKGTGRPVRARTSGLAEDRGSGAPPRITVSESPALTASLGAPSRRSWRPGPVFPGHPGVRD